MEIGFDNTNYVIAAEATVLQLCGKIYTGQLGVELILVLQNFNGSAYG